MTVVVTASAVSVAGSIVRIPLLLLLKSCTAAARRLTGRSSPFCSIRRRSQSMTSLLAGVLCGSAHMASKAAAALSADSTIGS